MTKPATPATQAPADYATGHGNIQLSARVGLGFRRRNLQQIRCSCAVRARGQIWQAASAKSSKRPIFQTPPGELGHIDKSESLSRNSFDLTTLAKAFSVPWGQNPPVGLILCARAKSALARYALDGLPNKIMAAEYRTVLPDVELLQAELEKTRRELEAREIGRSADMEGGA